jgi:hypothetical protein
MRYRFVKPSARPRAMHVNAPDQIIRHTDMQRSTRLTCENAHRIGHFEVDGLPVKPDNNDRYTRIGIST